MKWEVYEKLTEEQRVEWTFKFGNITYPHIPFVYIIVIWSSILSFMAISLVVMKEYIVYEKSVTELMMLGTKTASLMMMVWLFDYIGQLAYYIYKQRQESKWLKKVLKNG